MKCTVSVAFVTLLSVISLANANVGRKPPLFVKSLEKLHHGPPIPPAKSRANVETAYIEQKLDHFDENETRTWQMRYMINAEHFVEGAPIFIFVGGEWTIDPTTIMGGHFYDIAAEHHGMLYYTEHRYYGLSRPTESITFDELKYLHVKQALADLAHFITEIRATNPALANSKVIISGCSYSATMVVWFKRLYPDLLDGGWASSAPILAKVDFREYKEVVGHALRELGSNQCYTRIQNGIAEMESMFANKRGAEVRAMLKLCADFNEYNDLDLWSLFGSISNIFAGIVQYQREGEVPYYCNELMKEPDDLTAIANFVYWAWGNNGCIDATYKSTLDYFKETSYKYDASRPWYYQTCNEYGWYQSSASTNQPFGTKFPAALSTTLCKDIFGMTNGTIYDNVWRTNDDFGGMNPEIKDVHMTHGAMDPWNPMGHGASEGATVIPLASHCADLGSIDITDRADMRAAKERTAEMVRQWLSDEEPEVNNDSNRL